MIKISLSLVVFFYLFNFHMGGFADYSIKTRNDILYMTNMYLLESAFNPGDHINAKITDPDFIQYNSGPLPVTIKNVRRMYTFREDFTIDPALSNVLLSLYLGPCSYPYNVYINGNRVLSRGNDGRIFRFASYNTVSIQLFPDSINFGETPNELVIQAYPMTETAPLNPILISSDLAVSRMVFFSNFFNVQLIQSFFVIAIVIGLYFIFLFAARDFTDIHYLYFAMFCFSFSFSYFNIMFHSNLSDEFFMEKISRFSFPFAALFMTLFLREFTGIAKKFWVLILMTLPPLLTSIYILTLKTTYSLDIFFDSIGTTFGITPILVFGFVLPIIAFYKTHKKSLLIIIPGYIFIFTGSIHDIMYAREGIKSFFRLIPYSFLIMTISLFLVLAIEESTIYTGLKKRLREIDNKNTAMNKIIQKIELVSQNLVHSSKSLEDNIGKAATVIRNSSKDNKLISDRLIKELKGIDNVISQITSRMELTVEKIPQAISNQTAVVEETNRTVSSMNDHISKILQTTEQTNTIAQELSQIASSGRDIVLKSKESIKEVSLNSQFISEILFNIREIVEESNFLSINASIESAHAGESGKGFSILANEIRELSNKSRERLEMSQDRLKQMIAFVNESISLSEEVTSSLLAIMDKSQNSADMIKKITEQMNEHKAEFGDILKGSGALLQETLSIKSMSDDERKENESLKKILSGLKESFLETEDLLKAQMESENNIREAIDRIQEVLGENLSAMDLLKESVLIGSQQHLN